jgi:predicted DNA binding CopG/RHH family protein
VSGVRETTSAVYIMSNKTTAENLERRFAKGEDVTDYFDLAKASRPLLQKERINLDIPHWMILKIDRVARRKGMPRQAQIKEWLSQKLKEEEPSAT